jgi:hypothetical protein
VAQSAWRAFGMILLGGLTAACGPASDPLASLSARLPDAVGEWRAAGEDGRYDATTIFDYLDGHAEVYLAYGMKGCLARRYVRPQGPPDLVLDLFRMASPEDAYGVFTWDQDGDAVAVGQGGWLRPGWLSAWKGDCFISVTADGDPSGLESTMVELGRAAAAAVEAEGQPPAVVTALPRAGLAERSVRYLHSAQALALQLGARPGEGPPLPSRSGVALARYRRDGGEARLLLLRCTGQEEAERTEVAVERWLQTTRGEEQGGQARSPAWSGVKHRGPRLAVVVAASSPELGAALIEEALQ